MLKEKDLGRNMRTPGDKVGVCVSNGLDFVGHSEKCSVLGETNEYPIENNEFCEKGKDYLRESGSDRNRGRFEFKNGESGGSQELTFSYMCDTAKGKGVVVENSGHEEKWVERDFLQLSDSTGGSSKRDPEGTQRGGDLGKKPRLESLKLSLALPILSLSLSDSAAAGLNSNGLVQVKHARSVESSAVSNSKNSNTHVTDSNNFTAGSLSYSYSHHFSHNPSCSLTHNSTVYYEHSDGSCKRGSDQIWNAGEGTNGSVHSYFRLIGDGSGVGYGLMNGGPFFNKESSNSLYRPTGSGSSSFFPSELPAKTKMETTYSIDLRGEKIVWNVVIEPIHVMARLFQEFPIEIVVSAKEYVKSLILLSERKVKLVELQALLECRPDPTKEALSKANKAQLEILVALRFGVIEFVSGKVCLEMDELVEIFLYMRCQNVDCKSFLPVDDCDCKICSTKKGFCSHCMCPVCNKYDCANNTCSWVGCDACSHWCHAICGIEKNYIRPGPSKGSSAMSEMQFYCIGCDHASDMFGFVKEVFVYCAKNWGLKTLVKELDCVRRIFKGSEDLKGKELYLKAAEMITRLGRQVMSPLDACNFILWFFTSKKSTPELPATGAVPREPTARPGALLNDSITFSSPNAPSKCSTHTTNATTLQPDLSPYDVHHKTPNHTLVSEHCFEDDTSRRLSKNNGMDNLQRIVHIKEVESKMFQKRADEAKKEVEAYRDLVLAKTKKLEEEYSQTLEKLCLVETEERRHKKLEELKIIESAHSDYYNMKKRMQDEIRGLLDRMEATMQQLV